MRLLAVVVTYYPEKKLLEENINAIYDYTDKILIWENTPKTDRIKYRFFFREKIEYCGGDINSISHALNCAWRYAQKQGYDYLLTMDQDSIWSNFALFKQTVLKYNEKRMCIIGPFASDDVNNKKIDSGVVENRWQITSGMLIRTALLNQIGGYNESFSVDCIDIELCLRAKRKGYRSYYCYDGFLKQRYGELIYKKFFGHEFRITYYNSFRIRGIILGHILLYRTYHLHELIQETIYWLIMISLSIVLVKGDRLKRIHSLIKGIWDGLFISNDNTKK